MNIAVCTIDRSPGPNYVHSTLAHLSHLPKITLHVGNSDTRYVADLPFPKVTLPPFDLQHPAQLLAENFLAIANYYSSAYLYCEDDIEPCSSFHVHLNRAIRICELLSSSAPYILTLFCPQPLPRSGPLAQLEPAGSFGTVCLYVPTQSIQVCKDAYAMYKTHKYIGQGIDIALRKLRVPIYTTNPSLVQHIGHISTGCSGTPAQVYSPSFRKNV